MELTIFASLEQLALSIIKICCVKKESSDVKLVEVRCELCI